MKKYFNAKLILFKKLLSKNKNIIADGSSKEFLTLKKIAKKKKIKNFLKRIKNKFLRANAKKFYRYFSIKKLIDGILAAQLSKLNKFKIKNKIKKIENVDGRLELIRKFPNNIKVLYRLCTYSRCITSSVKIFKQ